MLIRRSCALFFNLNLIFFFFYSETVMIALSQNNITSVQNTPTSSSASDANIVQSTLLHLPICRSSFPFDSAGTRSARSWWWCCGARNNRKTGTVGPYRFHLRRRWAACGRLDAVPAAMAAACTSPVCLWNSEKQNVKNVRVYAKMRRAHNIIIV